MKKILISVAVVVLALIVFWGVNKGEDDSERTFLIGDESNTDLTYQSLYENNIDGERKILENIEKLKSALDGTDSDYNRYIDIALNEDVLGNGEEVLVNLKKAIEINPENPLAYNNIGTALEKVGAFQSAESAFMEALSKDPNSSYTYQLLIDLHKSYLNSDQDTLDDLFNEAIQETNSDIQIMKDYAAWLSNIKEYEKSLNMWREVLTKEVGDKTYIEAEIRRIESKI